MSEYQNKDKLIDNISQLYKNLGHLEKEVQEYEIQERRSSKRTNEGESNVVDAKRLKSTVVVKSIDEHQETEVENSPRPAAKPLGEGNRRLMQNLLFGTLVQRKKETEKPDEVTSKRMEVDKMIEDKVEKTPDLILQQKKEEIIRKKEKAEKEIKELKMNIEAQEKELNELFSVETNENLTYFAKTKTLPAVYFIPRKVDEWSQSTFGFKVPHVSIDEEVMDTETKPIEIEVNES